ncbi:MAG TPA: hypothetical protein VFL92_11955 [Sphingomonas sp.]|nr:hypothetical protein [Sphingomonas sp.]
MPIPARRLADDPARFPHMIDAVRDRLLLMELDERRLTEASFLDQRAITPDTRGAWIDWAEAEAGCPPGARDDAHWIFHIGHVGSSLISRLLGAAPGVLALREPMALRALAELAGVLDRPECPIDPAGFPARAALLRRLLARTFRPEQRAIVKATSFVSEIAPALVSGGAKALFLHVRPESYMRTILAGDASRQELAMVSGARLARLHRRLGDAPWRLWRMDEAAKLALGWATEMTALDAAEAAMPAGTALRLDFDLFLDSPAETLLLIAGHFGLALDEAQARALVASPIMQRYSKAPEHAYSPDLRRRLLDQAQAEHGTAITRGLAGLEAAAKEHPAIGRALDRAARS